jgi:hypothetical protein
MAHQIADRVQETTTTTGTGSLTLAGAVTNFQTFDSVMATGDTCDYCIVDSAHNAWEVGLGTFTATTTLARTTVYASSNAGAAVTLAAGSKSVFITASANALNNFAAIPASSTAPATPDNGDFWLDEADATDNVAAAAVAIGNLLFPVGSIYTNLTNATNPATLLGFGTWTAFSQGRVPVGKAASGTFATAGATGGEETHTLTITEMPSHSHTFSNTWNVSGSVEVGSGTFRWYNDTSESTNNTGGDGPHNNLQPYVVVYMWQRTA